MNEIQIIKNVHCFVSEDGMVQLNLEDVARGLGFVDNSKAKEYVRWNTVRSYLESFGFSQDVAKDTFIPEPIFYLLAMKADNETARAFQHTIAYDVLPAIRLYGMYAVNQLLDDPDLAIRAFTALKEERAKRKALEQKTAEQQRQLDIQKPFVAFAETAIKSYDNILMRDMAKLLCDEGIQIGEKRLYKLLREHEVLMGGNEPYQAYANRGYFLVKETTIQTPYGVKLRSTTLVTPKGQIWIVNKLLDWMQAA